MTYAFPTIKISSYLSLEVVSKIAKTSYKHLFTSYFENV